MLPAFGSSQCLVPPASPSCNPPGSIALANNDVVGVGQVKTLGGSVAYNSITMSGGTLIVCGSLTLNTISFSSGTLIINPGGSVLINSGSAIVFGNNSCIVNYGSFKITSSIVTGQNNVFYNATPSSVFTVAFNQFVIQGPNTYIINNGILNASYIIVQSTNSPGPVCSGPGSYMVCNFMINQYPNAFLSPDGPSCINITQWIINSQAMTTTSNVMICYMASSVSISGSPNFGAATVYSNCPSCMVALPLELTALWGSCDGRKISLSWVTEQESNVVKFIVERSANGIDFKEAGSMVANNKPYRNYYNMELEAADNADKSYFRIKEVDKNMDVKLSPLTYVSCKDKNGVRIYPAVSSGEFNVMADEDVTEISIYDIAGRLVKQEAVDHSRFYTFYPEGFARGSYVVSVKTVFGNSYNKKLVLID
jgi:hypothetical protein